MLSGQLSLLDAIEAVKRRDRGMALASDAQDRKAPKWSEVAYAAIERVARRQIHVHVDDVLREGVPQPHHPNAWGVVWMRAIKAGVIQHSNQTKPCATDKRKHAHRYPIYFSRVHDPRG